MSQSATDVFPGSRIRSRSVPAQSRGRNAPLLLKGHSQPPRHQNGRHVSHQGPRLLIAPQPHERRHVDDTAVAYKKYPPHNSTNLNSSNNNNNRLGLRGGIEAKQAGATTTTTAPADVSRYSGKASLDSRQSGLVLIQRRFWRELGVAPYECSYYPHYNRHALPQQQQRMLSQQRWVLPPPPSVGTVVAALAREGLVLRGAIGARADVPVTQLSHLPPSLSCRTWGRADGVSVDVSGRRALLFEIGFHGGPESIARAIALWMQMSSNVSSSSSSLLTTRGSNSLSSTSMAALPLWLCSRFTLRARPPLAASFTVAPPEGQLFALPLRAGTPTATVSVVGFPGCAPFGGGLAPLATALEALAPLLAIEGARMQVQMEVSLVEAARQAAFGPTVDPLLSRQPSYSSDGKEGQTRDGHAVADPQWLLLHRAWSLESIRAIVNLFRFSETKEAEEEGDEGKKMEENTFFNRRGPHRPTNSKRTCTNPRSEMPRGTLLDMVSLFSKSRPYGDAFVQKGVSVAQNGGDKPSASISSIPLFSAEVMGDARSSRVHSLLKLVSSK